MQPDAFAPRKASSPTDGVAHTSQLLAEISLESASGTAENSSTDSVQTPLGWAGGLLEHQQHKPGHRMNREQHRVPGSRDPGWRNGMSSVPFASASPHHRSRGSKGGGGTRPGYRRLWHQVTSASSGGGQQQLREDGMPEFTVEDLVAVIQKLPGDVPVVPAVADGLWTLDSRAAAALLKELAKAGVTARAFELFDWLRELPSSHELHALCDVFTYTTVIALCGQRQALRRSLGLMAEMRSRNIAANVHTYSALMNVCIKCGELDLALDVFNQLQVEGCRANVVTFNTLIDVYGKLGRWQDAVGVLGMMSMQGLQPETRTFNTIIIACNMCGQPHEALQVYARMTALGYMPTSTTYTALISAYGKAGQLDSALSTFEQMIARGCERNVITYSALISACEKAGRWQLALSLLDEMHRDKVAPNTVTFNSLISACAQGAQGARADSLFRAMRAQRCKPDIVTFAALVSAHERCADWRAALQAFEDMQMSGCRPDGTAYGTLIHALWSSGVRGPRAKALELHDAAVSNGLFSMAAHVMVVDGTLEVALSPSTPSVAVLALHRWLLEAQQQLQREASAAFLGHTVCILLGRAGKASRDAPPPSLIHSALALVLSGWQAPFCSEGKGNATRLRAPSSAVAAWLQSPAFAAGCSTITDSETHPPSSPRPPNSAQLALWEAAAESANVTSLASLEGLEARQVAACSAVSPAYAEARPECAQSLAALALRFAGGDHAVHEALAIMDRCVSAGLAFCQDTALLLVSTCFWLACRQHRRMQDQHLSPEAVEQHSSLPAGSLHCAADLVQTALGGDLAVATPLHYLDIFTAALNGAVGANSSQHGWSGPHLRPGPSALATAALGQSHALHLRPSLLAAAAVVVHRTQHGILPAWPLALAKLTGLQGPGSPEFDAALAVVGLAGAPSSPPPQDHTTPSAGQSLHCTPTPPHCTPLPPHQPPGPLPYSQPMTAHSPTSPASPYSRASF